MSLPVDPRYEFLFSTAKSFVAHWPTTERAELYVFDEVRDTTEEMFCLFVCLFVCCLDRAA
jgi:hypothetical protein